MFIITITITLQNSDGSSQAIGGCMRDYRNRPFPVKAVIRYEKSTLSVGSNYICIRYLRQQIYRLLF